MKRKSKKTTLPAEVVPGWTRDFSEEGRPVFRTPTGIEVEADGNRRILKIRSCDLVYSRSGRVTRVERMDTLPFDVALTAIAEAEEADAVQVNQSKGKGKRS